MDLNWLIMINQEKQLFPYCIVWTILPCFTWFFPIIGHAGICDSSGRIYDFLGYHINSGEMAFGKVIKYVRLYPLSTDDYDKAIHTANEKYSQLMHNLCCNNCHHHVADALEVMKYEGKTGWSQLDVWRLCLTSSKYVSWCGILKVYLPLMVMVGLILGLVLALRK